MVHGRLDFNLRGSDDAGRAVVGRVCGFVNGAVRYENGVGRLVGVGVGVLVVEYPHWSDCRVGACIASGERHVVDGCGLNCNWV